MREGIAAMEQPANIPVSSSKFKELPQRAASGLLLVVLAGSCLYAGGVSWTLFVAACACIMMMEWINLTKNFGMVQVLAGLLYVGLPCVALQQLSANALMILIAMIAATDIGAYFSGKLIGGAKLWPRVSPNKTWAGLLGGMLCACVVAWLMLDAAHAWMGAVVAVLGQVGDMFESWLKRRAGVKDSGKILPGHGGLLDRFDGYTLSAPFFAMMMLYGG